MKLLFAIVSLAIVGMAQAATTVKVPPGHATAVFAGGCFWCMEPPYDNLPGVDATISGYTGGRTANPSYEQVSSGSTGHAEAITVVYDPKKITYEKLVDVFWHNIDPTVRDQQFCDHGTQYRTAIFYANDEQRKIAEASKAALEKSKPFKEPVATEITMAGPFWPAEDYHQDFYMKNPVRYNLYRTGCGRDARLKQLWGDKAGGH